MDTSMSYSYAEYIANDVIRRCPHAPASVWVTQLVQVYEVEVSENCRKGKDALRTVLDAVPLLRAARPPEEIRALSHYDASECEHAAAHIEKGIPSHRQLAALLRLHMANNLTVQSDMVSPSRNPSYAMLQAHMTHVDHLWLPSLDEGVLNMWMDNIHNQDWFNLKSLRLGGLASEKCGGVVSALELPWVGLKNLHVVEGTGTWPLWQSMALYSQVLSGVDTLHIERATDCALLLAHILGGPNGSVLRKLSITSPVHRIYNQSEENQRCIFDALPRLQSLELNCKYISSPMLAALLRSTELHHLSLIETHAHHEEVLRRYLYEGSSSRSLRVLELPYIAGVTVAQMLRQCGAPLEKLGVAESTVTEESAYAMCGPHGVETLKEIYVRGLYSHDWPARWAAEQRGIDIKPGKPSFP